MYREKLVECADCDDRFKIIYDSRKDRQDEYRCKCGKLVCHSNYFGGFSYNRCGRYQEIPYEEREIKYEYYEEDYIRLTVDEQKLLNEIDMIGTEFGTGYSSPYSNRSDEDDIELSLDGSNSKNEGLTISLKVRLKSYGNGWSEREVKNKHERLLEGLSRFKDIILKVKNNEIDLNKPHKVWNDNSFEWNGSNKEQQELYDYELYC